MNPRETVRGIHRLADAGLIALFFLFLWLPTFDSIFHVDRAPTPNEKRLLNACPEWSLARRSPGKFLAGVDAWFSDHFGFRNRLIRLHHKWERDIFRESSFSEVVVGRDGWLFYGGRRMIDNYRGASLFTTKELVAWRQLLEARRDWLAQRGIRYLFIVAPNKESIYPEQLPEWLAGPVATRKLDQFMAHMRAHSSVEVLDLRPALLEAKKEERAYLLTDSHWNAFGAFAAYQSILRAMGRQFPELDPLPIEAFDRLMEEKPAGDLAELLGQAHILTEGPTAKLVPKPPRAPLQPKVEQVIAPQTWTQERRPVYTEQPGQTRRIVLFRDSYANALQKYLGFHFARALYLWQPNWNTKVIERERPDIVVDEVLERYFNERDPRELRRADALSAPVDASETNRSNRIVPDAKSSPAFRERRP